MAELDSLRVKLTYGGPQQMPIPTIVFAAPGTQTPLSMFTPYRRAGFDYSNDNDETVSTFSATLQELKAVIDGVGALPRATDGDADPKGHVSFALLHSTASGRSAFEAIVNDTTGRALFPSLVNALAGNIDGPGMISDFACATAMLPKEPPANMEGRARATVEGWRKDRTHAGQYVGRVTVLNTSASAIPSPLYLVVALSGNATLLTEDGAPCNVAPTGASYIVVARTAIPPGAAVRKSIRLANPSGDKYDVVLRVFAGPGTP